MPNFSLPGQQEAGEFLIYFLSLFNSQNVAVTQHTSYATNSTSKKVKLKDLIQTHTSIDKNASIVVFIDSFTLFDKRNLDNHVYHFLKHREDTGILDENNLFTHRDKKYIRKISYNQIIDAPQLILWAQRANPITNTVLRTRIIPNRIISLRNKKKLRLYSIVLHLGNISNGHYITYFRNKKMWYLYDDVSRHVSEIGDYTQLLNFYPNVSTHGVLFFYG
jgi:ubiquitin C-terminal hydrolase